MLEWADLFALGRGAHDVHSLRFISGAKPADLLAASMAAEPFLIHILVNKHWRGSRLGYILMLPHSGDTYFCSSQGRLGRNFKLVDIL